MMFNTYTHSDWHNRNQIKGPHGLTWLSIPMLSNGKYRQKIRERAGAAVTVNDAPPVSGSMSNRHWQNKSTLAGGGYFRYMGLSRLRKYVSDSAVNWAIADQALVSVVNFLTAILLARYLGVDEYGRFTLLWLFILFIGNVQHAVVTAPMMSIGPKQSRHELPGYYGGVIAQQLGFMAVILLATIIGMQSVAEAFPEWRIEEVSFPVCGALAACGMQDFVRRYLFTCGSAYAAFINDAMRYIGQLVGLFLFIEVFRGEISPATALWTMCATAALATLSGAVVMEKPKYSYLLIRKAASRHWQFSRWLLASTILYTLSSNLFILVAGTLLGAKAVGALKAAQTLMGVTHILFCGLENVTPARASLHFHEGGTPRLVNYLWRIGLLGGLATAAVAVVAVAAPEFWLKLAFGNQYAPYGYLVVWYAVSYVLLFFGVPLRAGIRALEHTRVIFFADLWMLLVGLVAAYPLVSFLGAQGAVLGSVVVNIVLAVTLSWGFKKGLKLSVAASNGDKHSKLHDVDSCA